MRVTLPEAVNVDGLQFEAGEHEIHDPYWLKSIQSKLGKKVKLGEDAPEYLKAEQDNAVRYAKQAALAQLEAELTRQAQWAPVLYARLREADLAQMTMDSKSAMSEDADKLRASISQDTKEDVWNSRTAFYHPDRTEAQPTSIPGSDPGPLNPSLEITAEDGDERIPVYTGEDSVSSTAEQKAIAEGTKTPPPTPPPAPPASQPVKK